eukprot:s4105_g5.t1
MNSKLRTLELDNLRLRETVEARPRLELSRSLNSPASLSTSLGLKSEGSQADQSWSLALSSAKLQKAAGRDSALPKAPRILKGVSFHEEVDQNGSAHHIEQPPNRVNTFVSVDSVLSEEKVPTKSILKKNSSYRFATSPESSLPVLRSRSVGLQSKAVPVHGKSFAYDSPTISRMTKNSILTEDNTRFAVLRADKTRVFVMQKPWYIINPDSNTFATIWQFVTSAALLWIAFVTPLQVGLVPVQIDWVFVTSLVVDFLFLIDMCLQFFTAYVQRTPRGDELEVRSKQIVMHYLSTWFVLDFITLIPFELVAFLSSSAVEKVVHGTLACTCDPDSTVNFDFRAVGVYM